jgi:uncharacterized protein YciI
MPLYCIRCKDVPNSAPLREKVLTEHRAYLTSQADKIVVAGAALAEDGETATGSVFIVNVPDIAAAEAFNDGDPFTPGGVFESRDVTRMRAGFWFPENVETA